MLDFISLVWQTEGIQIKMTSLNQKTRTFNFYVSSPLMVTKNKAAAVFPERRSVLLHPSSWLGKRKAAFKSVVSMADSRQRRSRTDASTRTEEGLHLQHPLGRPAPPSPLLWSGPSTEAALAGGPGPHCGRQTNVSNMQVHMQVLWRHMIQNREEAKPEPLGCP